MRDLNANALAEIATTKGIEPVIIVDINWHGTIVQYADKDVDAIPGKILNVTNLDTIVDITSSSSSQEISITLDDIDGTIKTIIDNYDVHKRDVCVYQWFEGLVATDRFLLFRGKINSPIVWSESERTLSFNVVSNTEDNEIGYSAEEGQFENMPHTVIGQPWPMCFGTTTFSETLRLTARVKGTLADALSFPDFALKARQNIIATAVERMEVSIAAGTARTPFDVYANNHIDEIKEKLSTVTAVLANQPALNTMPGIITEGDFPDNSGFFQIGGITFHGTINGDKFIFSDYNQHPNIADFKTTFNALDTKRMTSDNRKYSKKTWPYETSTVYQVTRQYGESASPELVGKIISRSEEEYGNGGTAGDNAGYVSIQAGTQISLVADEPQTYVVSIVPGSVLRVSVWVEKEGRRFLQDIDSDDYTIYTETYGNLTVTFLEIKDALSKKRNFNWSDEIFVTFESDIGPNTVDILQYLIETYSDFTIDAVSFAAVHTKVANYPSHFAITDRKELFTVLKEIAWQARCAIWLKNGVFYIQYLSEEPTPVATITESDIEIETLMLEHTSTEDLVTKMVCNWRESGLQDKSYETILRHNVAKYGTHEQTYDFYIYNYVDAVIKSATFWMIRYANTWKKLKFTVPLTLLNIETFDAVTLDFTDNYVASGNVIAMVEDATYNSVDNSINMECWTPVKAGTMAAYLFAYPAGVDANATFPTDWEIQQGYEGGNSPGRDDVTREGHSPDIDREDSPRGVRYTDPYNLGNRQFYDAGNLTPSDINDVYPGSPTIAPIAALGPSISGAFSILPAPSKVIAESILEEEEGITIPCIMLDPVPIIFDPNTLPSYSSYVRPYYSAVFWLGWDARLISISQWCNREFGPLTIDGTVYPDGECNLYSEQWGALGKGGTFSDSSNSYEKFVFNSLESAEKFKEYVVEYLKTCNQVVGHPAIKYISDPLEYLPTIPEAWWPARTYRVADNIYGMLAYSPSYFQNPWTTGVGSWLAGGPPIPAEWVNICNGEQLS